MLSHGLCCIIGRENRMKIVRDRDHIEYVFSAKETLTSAQLKNGDYWIADSGASTHLTFDDCSMKNIRSTSVKVVMGNSSSTKSAKTGDISGLLMMNKNKKAVSATLQDVAYAKDAQYNLFSLTYMMKKGWSMTANNDEIILKKGKIQLSFNSKVKTSRGFFCHKIYTHYID